MFKTSNQNNTNLPIYLGLFKSLGVLFATFLLYLLLQVAVYLFVKSYLASHDLLIYDGFEFSLITILTNAIVVAILLWGLKFFFSLNLTSYFPLKLFKQKNFCLGLLLLLLFYILFTCITLFLQKPLIHPFVQKIYLSAYSYSLLIIALIIAAPLFEEILFRGILFHELSNKVGVILAAMINSLVWTLIHFQYDWFYALMVFIVGMGLSLAYHQSKSLLLPIIFHAIWNSITLIEAIIFLN